MESDTLISQQNPQWSDSSYLPVEGSWPKREVFKEVKNWLNNRFILAATGIRRVGKSTILKQIISDLIKEEKAKDCLYFSFEKIQAKRDPDFLTKVVETYLNGILLKKPYEIEKKIYIFLDEVQNIPDWQEIIKFYYDQSENFKFIVSGSNSLFIKKKSQESLGGRIIEIKVNPLSFKEYLKLTKPDFRVYPQQKLWISSNIEILNAQFERYLHWGQFPEVISQRLGIDQTTTYLESIEEKITQQDLPKIFPIEYPEVLAAILNQMKKSPGQRVEYQSIAKDVGLDQRTLSKYFDYLEKGFLISLCYNFGKKPIKAPRIAKKAYLISSNFAFTASTPVLTENYIFNFLKQRFPKVYFNKDEEVDFVCEDKGGNLSIFEVKFQNKISNQDEKNMINFMQARRVKKAILVTKNKYAQGKKISQIPASLMEFYLKN